LTGDILSQDFVEALRAKGLRETYVFSHVIRMGPHRRWP